jgi:hypothetical protein
MKRATMVIVLAILVIAGAAAAVFSDYGRGTGGTGANTSGSPSLTSTLPTNCTTTFPDGLALRSSGNETRLFTLLPGGTGLICVTYSVDTDVMAQDSETIQFGSSMDVVHASLVTNPDGAGYVYSYSYQTAYGVTGSADPSSITFQRGSGNGTTVTVVYAIVAAQNSSGFYSLSFTSCSPLIPFAVTSDWQKVGGSDFPGFFNRAVCSDQAPLSDPRVTGLAAINTTLLVGQQA